MSFWTGKHGVYLIAEVGGNHEGDFEAAQRLTELACQSGADAVKFQIYSGDSLVSAVESPDRHKHYQRFALSKPQYLALAEQCQSSGVIFNASVWDIEAIEWIDSYMSFYKIGSGDLTAYPLLKAIAKRGKPILLSTGLSTLDEVREAVQYLQKLDHKYKQPDFLALLQCTSMYPIPDSDANLKVMDQFRREFGLAVGYSDHTTGTEALRTAVAMGAQVLEFHFTDTREGKSFRDHKVSLTRDEVEQLIANIKIIKTLQGTGNKEPMASEIASGQINSFRRAVYPNRDLPAGAVLTEEDLVALRPNHGIDARDFERLIGKRLRNGVRALQALDWENIH